MDQDRSIMEIVKQYFELIIINLVRQSTCFHSNQLFPSYLIDSECFTMNARSNVSSHCRDKIDELKLKDFNKPQRSRLLGNTKLFNGLGVYSERVQVCFVLWMLILLAFKKFRKMPFLTFVVP